MITNIFKKIAENLYTKGYISYPRTETDQYSDAMDFKSLISEQQQSSIWGAYCTRLLNGEFNAPRKGKNNDKAHPPIHPTKFVNPNSLESQEHRRVYDLIVRHFLGSCSNDALGNETRVSITISSEYFRANGLVITQRNYLEIYTYDSWTGRKLPNFSANDEFIPHALEMVEGRTSPPSPLTEEELISLMYKNGIGTDATIPSHIETIQSRGYAIKQGRYFHGSDLGIALLDGYVRMGMSALSEPGLRAEMENGMQEISRGTRCRTQFVHEVISQMRQVFDRAVQGKSHLESAVAQRFASS
jgi:DNA topoisomerase-3